MTDNNKIAAYARVGTRMQANPQTEKKLEAVRLLQEIGYTVAVAPVEYTGNISQTKQLPVIAGLSSGDPEMEIARSLLSADQTLVITGREADHA